MDFKRREKKILIIVGCVFLFLLGLWSIWYSLRSSGKGTTLKATASDSNFTNHQKLDQKIYFVKEASGNFSIFAFDGEREEERFPLKNFNEDILHLKLVAVSSDGRSLLVNLITPEGPVVYVFKSDNIVINLGPGVGKFFSPDSNLVVFERRTDRMIVLARVESEEKVLFAWTLPHGHDLICFNPINQDEIFVKCKGFDDDEHVYSVHFETGRFVESILNVNPNEIYSPDGKKSLLYMDSSLLYIIDRDSSVGKRHLLGSFNLDPESLPIWSRNGQSILVAIFKEDSTDFSIEVLKLDPEQEAIAERNYLLTSQFSDARW